MICRLCLTKSENYLEFFNENGLLLELATIVSKYFWFEPQKNDSISNIICNNCWLSIENFHKFYLSIEKAQNNLNTVEINFNEDEDDKTIILKLEESSQDLNIVDYNLSITQTATNDKLVNQQHEVSENIHDPLDNDEKLKTHNNIKFIEKHKFTKCLKKSTNLKTDKCNLVNAEKLNQSIDENDEKILAFMKLICDECQCEFQKFILLKKHIQMNHNRSGFIKCCNKKFYKRIYLIEHINIHLNPDYFRCEECKKSFGSRRAFELHKLLRHQTNDTKLYQCDLCPRKYITKYLLDQHIIITHSGIEKKWKCDVCEKLFITKNRMITHKSYMHTNAYSKICDICAKVCRSKTIFDKHMLEHKGTVQPKLQCELCQAWLKNSLSLKKHMIRHKEENIQHICNICGKSAASKFALKNHLRYVHTEASYKCTVCEKSFKKPIRLKEHMSTHTGEILYTCPLCPKTFNSNANMWSHKKKVHRIQWEIDRQNRKAPQAIDLKNN